RDAPVAPAKEPSHVRTAPDEIPDGPRAVDKVGVRGVRQQLPDIGGLKRPVRLEDAQEISFCLFDSTPDRGAISLARFEDLASGRCRPPFRAARLGAVVDDAARVAVTKRLDPRECCADR